MKARLIPLAASVLACGLAAGCGSRVPPTPPAQTTPLANASSPTPSPSPTGLTMTQVDGLVRTLYYNETEAYATSLQAGADFDYAHDYPGSTDKAKYFACIAVYDRTFAGQIATFVPEIDTLAPDPNWVGPPVGKNTDWLFAGKKPQGQTYILTLDEDYTSASGQQSNDKSQVHVTILNGVAYFYTVACPG